jgi:hypothetical protein
VENEILMHIRKIASQKGEISLDEPINTDWDGNELLLSDVLGTLRLRAGDEILAELPLTAAEAVPRLTFREIWLRVLAGIFR